MGPSHEGTSDRLPTVGVTSTCTCAGTAERSMPNIRFAHSGTLKLIVTSFWPGAVNSSTWRCASLTDAGSASTVSFTSR
jgi:hypothetical protein